MNKYLHVGIYLGTGVIPGEKIERVQEVLSKAAQDWLRYAPNCWIVYSAMSPYDLAKMLYPQLAGKTPTGEDVQVLVFEVNFENYYGWVSALVKDWLIKHRA